MILRHTQVKNLSVSCSQLRVPRAGRSLPLSRFPLAGRWLERVSRAAHLQSSNHVEGGRRRRSQEAANAASEPRQAAPRLGRTPDWTPDPPALPNRPAGRAPWGWNAAPQRTPSAVGHRCAGARPPPRCSSPAAGGGRAPLTLRGPQRRDG